MDFPKGTSTQQMAALLENAGVIRHSWAFWMARAIRRSAKLQAGEYQFTKPASMLEVFDRISRGDIFYYELAVPEGKNMFDIAAAAEHLGLFSAAQFLRAARDPAIDSRSGSGSAHSGGLPVPEYLPAEPPYHSRTPLPCDDR